MPKPDENLDDIFTKINPDELSDELKAIYKSMQADYTRKTQGIADERKAFEAKTSEWEEKLKNLGAYEQRVNEWEAWYKAQEEAALSNQNNNDDDNLNLDLNNVDYLNEGDAATQKIMQDMQTKIDDLSSKLESTNQALKNSGDQVQRMFNYQAQLNQLSTEHTDLDQTKLIDYAVENGITDLSRAYKELYHDDLVEAEVQKRLQEKLTEQRTVGINSGGQQVIVRKPGDTPKTFGDATEQILQKKATEGTLN